MGTDREMLGSLQHPEDGDAQGGLRIPSVSSVPATERLVPPPIAVRILT